MTKVTTKPPPPAPALFEAMAGLQIANAILALVYVPKGNR